MPELVASRGLKRILVLTYASLSIAVLIVIGLIWWSSDDDLGPAPQRIPEPWSNEQQHLDFVHYYSEKHGPITLEQAHRLEDNAIQMCSFLTNNPSLPAAWEAGTESGMSSDQAATVIDLAIKIYCPVHLHLLGGTDQ